MDISENGVLDPSERYFSTPSDLAERLFFYVTICGHYYCNSNYYFTSSSAEGQLDTRLTLLLFSVVKGKLQFQIGDLSFVAGTGDVALIDCRRPHEYRSVGNSEFLWIHLDGANARQFFEEIVASKRNRQAFSVPNGDEIHREMARIINSLRVNRGLPYVERSKTLYRLLCDLLLVPDSNYGEGEDTSPLGEIIRAIDKSLGHDWTLRELARLAAMSRSHFCRYFRERTGTSPHQFVLLKRIDQAKYLLQSSMLSVKEIAFKVGFHSESRFTTAFQTKVGATPQNYRKHPYGLGR